MTIQTTKSIPSWLGGLVAASGAFGLWMVVSWLGFTAPSELTSTRGSCCRWWSNLLARPRGALGFEDTRDRPFSSAAVLFNAGIDLEGLRLINLLLAICSAGLVGTLVTTRWHSAAMVGCW